jgi:hypothetical protein
MADNKTKPTAVTAAAYLAAVEHPGKRADAAVLDALFSKVTGHDAVMWGPSIVGYGQYHYRYESGREGDMCRVGFSPRKAKHSLYVACTCDGPRGDEVQALLDKLGKYSQGDGGCLYVNKLADVDLAVLEDLVALGWQTSLDKWPD